VTVTADGRLFIDYARFHDVTPDGVSANVSDGGDGRADDFYRRNVDVAKITLPWRKRD
jgi:hypothetical protein